MLRNTVSDKKLAVDIHGGVLLWIGLWWWRQPIIDLSWPLHAPLRFILPVVIYPLLEEIIFRGGVQPFLLKYSLGQFSRNGVTLANLTTSIIFAFTHFLVHGTILAAATFFPSLAFGYFRDRYGSLTLPIVLHSFYNCGYVLLFAA